jgi:GNAT superfamily N-acetyltransferase
MTDAAALAGRIAMLHRDTALEAFAGIFPPEAPPPTLAALTADWAARLAAPPPHVVLVAEEDARLVGVVAAGPDPEDATAGHLSRPYVTPPSWGRGIGRSLHDRALPPPPLTIQPGRRVQRGGWLGAGGGSGWTMRISNG